MKNILKRLVNGIGIITLSIILITGCGVAVNTTKTSHLPSNSKLLIMPPRDVVQRGLPHDVGRGSGRQLQKVVQRELDRRSKFDIVLFESNDKFNHTNVVKRDDVIAESEELGVDYCLILTLGEFLNAAPMTFRPDFVTLESGVLIDVKTKKEVWSLNRPFKLDKPNIGNHLELIDEIAVAITGSIIK